MLESTWFKRILYIIYTIGCAFSGYVIYYAANNGTLYTSVFDHLIVKLLILGIPAALCIIIDMIYHPYDMIEAFAWPTSFGVPFTCLLVGYLMIGDKQEISVFGLSIPTTVIYIVMYALSVLITYLVGLLAIWVAEDENPKSSSSKPVISDEEHRKMMRDKYEMFVAPPAPKEEETDAYGRPRPF